MEIKLHPTTKLVNFNGVPARLWEGETSSGIPVHAFITRIAVQKDLDASELSKELKEVSPPSPELEAYPLRMILGDDGDL